MIDTSFRFASKIKAVHIVRVVTGFGLIDAKKLVDLIELTQITEMPVEDMLAEITKRANDRLKLQLAE